MQQADHTLTPGPQLHQYVVSAMRPCTMVVEAVSLEAAGAQAKFMCERDKRKLLSVEPLTGDPYAQPPLVES